MLLLDTIKGYPLDFLIPFLLPIAFNSYIHPDEHFQSLEPLAAKLLGYSVHLPWEYAGEYPARSYGVLYLYYGPLIWSIRTFMPFLSPTHILYLVRFQNLLVSGSIITWSLSKLIHNQKQLRNAMHFVVTSYVFEVYQTHTFSNSIETAILMLALALIENLRTNKLELKLYAKSMLLGVLLSVGIFNRVTFVAWMFLPSLFLLRYLFSQKSQIVPMGLGFAFTSLMLIVIDSISFGQSFNTLLSLPGQFYAVITPWNNLVYNSQYENLAQHGIHPWYTHIFVNLPQILGPLLLLLPKGIPLSKISILPVVSAVGGVLILSLIPHQELRFLTPMLPLTCTFVNYDLIDNSSTQSNNCFKIKKLIGWLWGIIGILLISLVGYFHRPSAPFIWYIFAGTYFTTTELFTTTTNNTNPFLLGKAITGWLFFRLWVVFNLALNVLMGVYHQGGVVSVLGRFHSEYFGETSSIQKNMSLIFWRTYSPPSWILGDRANSLQSISVGELDQLELDKSNLIDVMGTDFDKVCILINDMLKKEKVTYIVLPSGSFPTAQANCENIIWHRMEEYYYPYHYDLDHFDFSDFRTLMPGLDVYKVTLP